MLCHKAVKISFFFSFTLCGCNDRFTAPTFINGRCGGGWVQRLRTPDRPTVRRHFFLKTLFPQRSFLQPAKHLRKAQPPLRQYSGASNFLHPTPPATASSDPPPHSQVLLARRRTEGGAKVNMVIGGGDWWESGSLSSGFQSVLRAPPPPPHRRLLCSQPCAPEQLCVTTKQLLLKNIFKTSHLNQEGEGASN